MSEYDAVVIGAGHNGLAVAVMLAEAGWKVAVFEKNSEPGGAVRTEEVTLPGFRHDLFAANLNLFAGSPFVQRYRDQLAAHGLEFAPASKPFASVFPGDRYLGVTTDSVETADLIAGFSPEDAEAWADLAARFDEIAPHLFPLLGVPLPSFSALKAIIAGTRALGRRWLPDLARLVLQSTREFTEEHFESREVRALVASWGMHLDFAPDISGGALFPFIETFASAKNGMVLGKGGARNMIDALVSLLESQGGEVHCGRSVREVAIAEGAASGIVLENGEVVTAKRAVVANLTPPVLFGTLVPQSSQPEPFRRRVQRYRHGPGTMMIHLALDDLPPWQAGEELGEYSYVHIGPYMEDMALAYQQAVAGLLPSRPTLVVGQPTAVDPTRAPDGKHILWVQVRMVPGVIAGDAADEIEAGDWDTVGERYADRVIGLIEEHASGLTDRILGRHVLTPKDLESYNPNLSGGDSLGGSHHLMQHFALRPFPGWTRYRTPISRLYMCGAGTWPGAGVGAGSGYLLGRMLTSRAAMLRTMRS
ncbi:MAG: NAD(P)/FAD-dependent oxidoreductase [Actinobacteria bacterium]|nr:NAD(P)/FAD-dependent oxidoreductase [Actinomycetota bacterium]